MTSSVRLLKLPKASGMGPVKELLDRRRPCSESSPPPPPQEGRVPLRLFRVASKVFKLGNDPFRPHSDTCKTDLLDQSTQAHNAASFSEIAATSFIDDGTAVTSDYMPHSMQKQ